MVGLPHTSLGGSTRGDTGLELTKSPRGLSFTSQRQLLHLSKSPNKSCNQSTSSKEPGGQGMAILRELDSQTAFRTPSPSSTASGQHWSCPRAPAGSMTVSDSPSSPFSPASAGCPDKLTQLHSVHSLGVIFQHHLQWS